MYSTVMSRTGSGCCDKGVVTYRPGGDVVRPSVGAGGGGARAVTETTQPHRSALAQCNTSCNKCCLESVIIIVSQFKANCSTSLSDQINNTCQRRTHRCILKVLFSKCYFMRTHPLKVHIEYIYFLSFPK